MSFDNEGAGKTTLMDVLALRKSSGEIEGEVCLNGHPQDPLSFRRCTGYVEQVRWRTYLTPYLGSSFSDFVSPSFSVR